MDYLVEKAREVVLEALDEGAYAGKPHNGRTLDVSIEAVNSLEKALVLAGHLENWSGKSRR